MNRTGLEGAPSTNRSDARAVEAPTAAHLPLPDNPLVALCGARLIGVAAGPYPPNPCAVCDDLFESVYAARLPRSVRERATESGEARR